MPVDTAPAPAHDYSSSAQYRCLQSSLTEAAPAVSPADVCIAAVQGTLQTQRKQAAPLSELAAALQLRPDRLSELVKDSSRPAAESPPHIPSPEAELFATLADVRLHHLFELWDLGGKGHLSFSDVTLGLRRLCASSQKVYVTASDAAEVLFLYGADGVPRLDRLQFAAFTAALCQGLGLEFQDMADLLLLLSAVPADPQHHMAALLAESAMVTAFAKAQPVEEAEEEPSDETGGASA